MPTTRETLIRAAARLVDDGGPAAVTLREVGRLAGVSHNAPYKHFTDKQDLLAVVAANELRRLASRMRAAIERSETPMSGLEAAVHAYLDWAQRHPARFKLTFGTWEGPYDELGKAAADASEVLDDCVAAAHADGLRGDPEWTVALLRALGHGAVDLRLSGHLQKRPNAPGPHELVSYLIDILGRSDRS